MRTLVAVMLGALLGACATLKNDRTVCPEYRDLRCVGTAECSMDQTRGCKVCQCASMDPDVTDRQGRQPDQRNPDPNSPR